jgi:hypothetical protein
MLPKILFILIFPSLSESKPFGINPPVIAVSNSSLEGNIQVHIGC